MSTRLRPRSTPLWRCALPVVTAVAVVASTMPARAFTDTTIPRHDPGSIPRDVDHPRGGGARSPQDQARAPARDAGQALDQPASPPVREVAAREVAAREVASGRRTGSGAVPGVGG
ncbi:hypothetical protein [Saccharothrix lopnurensis]|uniref:Uncharacterized protein n=1 Tax=Saccharothrix lopnurensis TaxID=1670621 RepID=A0ABW1PF99_9PSEU